jgi:enamine deaminase RidA (YjgF/YER057c/UK114 family)
MTHTTLQPDGWAPAKGYANGILAEGRTVWVAGQIGWNGDKVFEAEDFAGQTAQALRNVVAVVEAAGGSASDIVRMTWYVTDKAAYVNGQREIGAAYREIIGRHFPAMTLVIVAGLLEDKALVEIEATAVLPG